QGPIRQSLFASLRKDGHWKCFCLTALIIGCLVAITWCHLTIVHKRILTYMEVSITTSSDRLGPCKEGYIYIPVAFVIMLYLVYLVECWHSHSRLELSYKCDIDTVYSTIARMQNAQPVIWWKATCYHYVRRTRHVLRYRNGDAFTSTQVYYERVDSKTAGAAYNYSQAGVKDISRPLSDLEKYPAIKIKISKGFSFANLDTEFDFEEQRAQFFQEYETKDDYMEGREGMDLLNVDFKEYMIAFRDPDRLPWYVSHAVFWLASLVLLSWPLRAIIEYKTAHLHYHIHKLFGSNYLDSENYPNMMSRVSTMNSVDLEMSIRNNNVIVPSYSEVVLTDAHLRRDYGAIKTRASRFPRSLTNVTLASRSSSVARPLTPAVTMNQVKRFKSCSAFVKSESTESALGNSTVRHQIQQLLRDRHRLQNKMAGNSSSSISGISMANGNVRFNVGTPVSPDDTSLSQSFSCHSVASFRGIAITPSDVGAATSSRASRPRYQTKCSQGVVKSKKSNNKTQTFGSIIRSKSVPGSAQGPHDLASSFRSHPIDSSSEASTSSDSGHRFVHSQVIPSSKTQMLKQLTGPVMTGLPSPPSYDVAIRMKRITSPCRAQLITAAPASLPNTQGEIRLAEFSLAPRMKREIPVTVSLGFHDRKHSTDLITSVQPAGQQIDNDLSEITFLGAVGNNSYGGVETQSVSHVPTTLNIQQPPIDQSSLIQHAPNQLSPRPFPPPLKSLPKVCIPNVPSDSDESDSDYLPSAASELGSLENVQFEDDQVRISQTLQETEGSIDRAQGYTPGPAQERLTLLNRSVERNTPSTSVASAAVALASSHRRPLGANHKETPV
ncbi:transmembrane protein 151B, partial [Biomphalaria pfeifferi]